MIYNYKSGKILNKKNFKREVIYMSKVSIITGGSRGIGEAMALKLGELGYNVVINYRSDSSFKKTVLTLNEKRYNILITKMLLCQFLWMIFFFERGIMWKN